MTRFTRRLASACLALLLGWASGCGLLPVWNSLPVYTIDQTDSSHAGYRRTTISSGGNVFVHDFEESSLQLANRDPRTVVGRTPFGGGGICEIEGQSPAAWLAVDMGSEMPAFEVFRAERQPPFDWRRVTFQKMQLDMLKGPAANRITTDPTVIEDVVRTLRDGAPAAPFTVEYRDEKLVIRANWIPASAAFSSWSTTGN